MRAERRDANIRQKEIAKTALQLVATGGMKNLSVARIAKRIGVVPSALYRHYGSKDEILNAVLDLMRDKLMANLATVERKTKDPLEKLHELLMLHLKLIRENQAIPRIVFSEDVYSGHQGRREQIYTIIRDYLEKIEEVVAEGQNSGHIRKDVAPENVALIFFGLVQSSAVLWHLSDGDFDITREARKNWAIIERAVKK